MRHQVLISVKSILLPCLLIACAAGLPAQDAPPPVPPPAPASRPAVLPATGHARILGRVADGMLAASAPPEPTFVTAGENILKTTTVREGGRNLTIRKIRPLPLPPPTAAPPRATELLDHDRNGISDVVEGRWETNHPPASYQPTADQNGDGWDNLREAASGTTPDGQFYRVAVTDVDGDWDGLSDHEEYLLGADPSKPDNNYDYSVPLWDATELHQRFWRIPNNYLICPDDGYETFACASQSSGYATGQQGDTRGVFAVGNVLDVTPHFLTPEGLPTGTNAEAHKYHSGQFRSTIQKRWKYWSVTLDQMKTLTPKSR